MMWIAILMYLWAGATVGRMVYEFDVYEPENPPRSDAERIEARSAEIRFAWFIGAIWWVVLVFGLWEHVRNPRPNSG